MPGMGPQMRRPLDESMLLRLVMVSGLISGTELANRLKAARPGMGVIFISGYDNTQTVCGHPADGEADLLVKPFGVDELTSAVRRALDRAGRQRPRDA